MDFKLHENFSGPKTARIYARSFQVAKRCSQSRKDELCITYQGSQGFDLPMTIHWVKELSKEPVEIVHHLTCKGDGNWETYTFPANYENIKSILSGGLAPAVKVARERRQSDVNRWK